MATMINSPNFFALRKVLRHQFLTNARKVKTERWQGQDISKRPEMVSYELLNYSMSVPLAGREDLDFYRFALEPNLPWADDHFAERVSGEPLNPGETWKTWPWAQSADKFRAEGTALCTQIPDDAKQFNHTYMERYWPVVAGKFPGGRLPIVAGGGSNVNRGIRHPYGDMMDLVRLLANEPLTRQAWIPIFFPEDTGVGDGGRKPCTLGYQFIVRDYMLHVYYPLRSCDFIRHWQDDVYLTVRLLLWVLDECRKINPEYWKLISPGTYTMHCTSLHVFENDFRAMKDAKP